MYKLNEFKHFVYSRKNDIVGVCETKLNSSTHINIPGYKIYTCNRNRRGGGVALLVRETIDHSFVNIENFNGIGIVGISLFSRGVKHYV